MATFHRAASLSEIAEGEMKAVTVAGAEVALYNVAGEILATCDTCSHADASLADGWLDDDIVTCPAHGAEFSVRTGEALSLPASKPVATYPVRVEGDDILVAVGE